MVYSGFQKAGQVLLKKQVWKTLIFSSRAQNLRTFLLGNTHCVYTNKRPWVSQGRHTLWYPHSPTDFTGITKSEADCLPKARQIILTEYETRHRPCTPQGLISQ